MMSMPPAGAYRAFLRRSARLFANGLMHLGAATAGIDPRLPAAETEPPAPEGPPRGHPERLTPHVPPSRTERKLWTQLF